MTLKQCKAAAEIIKGELIKAGYELNKTEENRTSINAVNKEINCNKYNYIHPEHKTRIYIQYCGEILETDKYELIAIAHPANTEMRIGIKVREKDLEGGLKKSVNRFISTCNRIIEQVRKTI